MGGARATSWRRAVHRLKAPPGSPYRPACLRRPCASDLAAEPSHPPPAPPPHRGECSKGAETAPGPTACSLLVLVPCTTNTTNGSSPFRLWSRTCCAASSPVTGSTIAPVGPSLAPYQPSQRYVVLDERHVRDDDVPGHNLMAAVVALEQSRSPDDLKRAVDALHERSWAPGERELERVFAEWVWRLARRLMPDAAALPTVVTLEDLKMTLEERVSEWPPAVAAGGDRAGNRATTRAAVPLGGGAFRRSHRRTARGGPGRHRRAEPDRGNRRPARALRYRSRIPRPRCRVRLRRHGSARDLTRNSAHDDIRRKCVNGGGCRLDRRSRRP